jgi:putative nucleotidyltransferase with HDIG domain
MAVAARRLEEPEVDSYPDDHALGVAELAGRVADELRLSARARRTVIVGALLHDVGKLLVDAAILSKPGPLTPAERRQVNRHPVEGERLVRGSVDTAVGDVVRAHHERWDGAGYPNGLSADEIPLAARVVAVADAFLAMLEQRPYRVALAPEAALEELLACAGSQFDPVCVDALVAAVAARR